MNSNLVELKDTVNLERARQVIREKTKIDRNASHYINRAWEILKKNLGSYIAFSIVSIIILVFLYFITALCFEIAIPYLFIFSFIFLIIFLGICHTVLQGYYVFTHRLKISNDKEFGNFFQSFQYTLPLSLQIILSNLILGLIWIPIAIIIYGSIDLGILTPDSLLGFEDAFFMFIGLFFYISLFLYYKIWYFAPLFIIFTRMNVLEAMNASRKLVWNNLGFMAVLSIVNGLIFLLGLITCYIGFIFIIPLYYITYYLIFNDIFIENEQSEMDDILQHLI